MEDVMYEEKFRGLQIKIYQDDADESPGEYGDNNLFLVGYHREFTVEKDQIITKQDLVLCFTNPKELDEDEKAEVEYLRSKYHIFGLEAYIHSGVCLALSREGDFPDRQWDVSQLGAVLVAREEWKEEADARNAALSLIDTWNDYLSGNIYGYVIEDAAGEHIDSCWGYYGEYEAGALAEARSIVDHLTNKGKTDHKGQYLIKT